MSKRTTKPRRQRWLAPEVVQTSAMDCGPAALKCLLEGFNIPVSYGRLREACQTNVDGTSIDMLEEVANQLGGCPTTSQGWKQFYCYPENFKFPDESALKITHKLCC